MNLINKRLLAQKIQSFEFPTGEKQALAKKLIIGWQKALKDSDLEKTKEKTIQGKFLNTFFENILDYSDVTTGENEWTLIQHPRIEIDSTEPDGSLGWFTKVKKDTRAVIELKDAKTLLDKKQIRKSGKLTPIEQAYLYATKYEGCNWIIVSNYKEIRLYNKNKTQEYYEKFEVLNLHNELEFKRFCYILCKRNLISKDNESVIDILAKDTTVAEQNITKIFYTEFKKLRLNLLDHIIKQNSEVNKEILLEKTQKLLDRLIFIMVCEDTSYLLPMNIVQNTYERAINSLSPSEERVWNEFKGLFLAIDKGNERVKPPINAYNGGLFAYDEILDKLHTKDEVWHEIIKLAGYDYETDLNVNILGHIFEQSISDLETIKETIKITLFTTKEESEKGGNEKLIEKIGKRKKEGIFYTPEYITKYIVENTIGKYLEDHPESLENIKILDPACGSGAFLNQAHSFLLKEHKNRYDAIINEKLEKGEKITLFDYNPADTNRGILLNNLYGVDLNQESVDITKLALWLKTARKSEPLQSLDKNIKCGNSLIDDPEIAGKKAFNWISEFPEILNDGGFDVIVGNPPYVGQKGNSELFLSFQKGKWEWFYERKQDLYYYFIAFSIKLLKPNGYLGMIVPQYWLTAFGAKNLRKLLAEQCDLISVLDLSKEKLFDDASINSSIFIFRKGKTGGDIVIEEQIDQIQKRQYISFVKNKDLDESSWDIFKGINYIDLQKTKNTFLLGEISKIVPGIQTGLDKVNRKGVFVLSDNEYNKLSFLPASKKFIKPLFKNSQIKRYSSIENNRFWILITNHIEHIDQYPDIKTHLLEFKDAIDSRFKNFALKNAYEQGKWWFLYGYRPQTNFETTKIIFPYRANQPKFMLSEHPYYSCMDIYYITQLKTKYSYKYILGILNSALMRYYFDKNCKKKGSVLEFSMEPMNKIPIPDINMDTQEEIIKIVDEIIPLTQTYHTKLNKIAEFTLNEYRIDVTQDLLDRFQQLGWNEFTELIESQKVELQIKEKEELFTWFKSEQKELQRILNNIHSLDNQIDQEVYKIYGLTEEDIKVVEEEKIL